MAKELSKRDTDIAYMTAAITWMNQAFAGQQGEVADMVKSLGPTFAGIMQSYEDEIECLKHALPVDNSIQIASLPAPVESVVE